jgi:1-acyl-sn-glycerol-3-phosphate acyltransferase
MRPYRKRNRIVFGRRRGYVRLAVRHGVPIVPVVAHGAHSTAMILDDGRWIVERLGLDRRFRLNAWPITLSLPWGITFGPPPPYVPWPSRITIEVLDPISFGRSGARWAKDHDYIEACHAAVRQRMQHTLDQLAATA